MILFETKLESDSSIVENSENNSTKTYTLHTKIDIEKEYYYDSDKTNVEKDDIDELLSYEIEEAVEYAIDSLTKEINTAIHKNSKYKNLLLQLDDTDKDFLNRYVYYYGSIEIPKNLDVKDIENIISNVANNYLVVKNVEDDLDIGHQIPGTGAPSFDPPEYYSVSVSIDLMFSISEGIELYIE